jgi:polar amino acid transport system substrate-binding protein
VRLRGRPAALIQFLRLRRGALLLLVVIVAAGVAIIVALRPGVSSNRPLRLTSAPWAPYIGPDLPDDGPMAKLVVEALRRAGYSPQVDFTSWSVAEQQVGNGGSNGVFPLVGSQERRAHLRLSDKITDFRYALFYKRGARERRITSAADLSGLTVGRIAGYDYWDELDSAVGRWVDCRTALECFEYLADGRVDLVAEGALAGNAVLADPAFSGDQTDFDYVRDDNPWARSTEGLYLMMGTASGSAEVIKAFNRELAKMRASGEQDRILAEVSGSAPEEVGLAPTGGSGLVELLDAGGAVELLAPQGTRAQVVKWPAEFGGVSSPPPRRILVQVKIVNGPAQGRVLYVDARALRLEPPS